VGPVVRRTVRAVACVAVVLSTVSVASASAAILADYDFAAATPSHVGCAAGLGSAPLASDSLASASGSFTHTDSGCDTGGVGGAFVTSGLGPSGNFPYAMVLIAHKFSLYSLGLKGTSTQDPGTLYAIEISKVDETAPGTVDPANPWTLVSDGFNPTGAFDLTFSFGPVTLQPGRYFVRVRPVTAPTPATAQLAFTKFVLGGDELTDDPTEPIGGTVGSTLQLTLGSGSTLGNFIPGVDSNYDANSTASIVSTAGDATLSVTDPAAVATGRLVNGAYALVEPLQAKAVGSAGSIAVGGPFAPLSTTAGAPLTLLTYNGPANDIVTITLRQHIGATQPLRTGGYAKTLTFTLSTTQP
jgi:hypothetical protein